MNPVQVVPPGDEVDHITAAWQAQLPGLDVEPMHVFSRIHRLADHLEATRRVAFSSHDLAQWEFDVLAALRRAGEPFELTPGRLVSETHVSSGTMTHRLDRLTMRGLVERHGSDGDRRIVLVRLTDAGRSRVDAAVAVLVQHERDLLASLSDQEASGLAALLRTVLRTYETDSTEPSR